MKFVDKATRRTGAIVKLALSDRNGQLLRAIRTLNELEAGILRLRTDLLSLVPEHPGHEMAAPVHTSAAALTDIQPAVSTSDRLWNAAEQNGFDPVVGNLRTVDDATGHG